MQGVLLCFFTVSFYGSINRKLSQLHFLRTGVGFNVGCSSTGKSAMKSLFFTIITLFVSYNLAGIGGLVLSLVPLALILSIVVSRRNLLSDDGEHSSEGSRSSVWDDNQLDKIPFTSSDGSGSQFEKWDGQPWIGH